MSDRQRRDAAIAAEQLRALVSTSGGRRVLREAMEAASGATSPTVAEPIVYTVADVADQIGKTGRTVRRIIASGDLTAHWQCGQWMVLADDLRSWVRTGRMSNATRNPARRTPLPPQTPGLRALRDEMRKNA